MKLNESTGNMYGFITHTGNVIKGTCYHDCSYCYMKKWGHLKPVRFDEKELNIKMSENNFIFVGSSCDMFNEKIPLNWINTILDHCKTYDNKYFFQSKNPIRFKYLKFPEKTSLCTTIESDIHYDNIMNNSPEPYKRVLAMKDLNYPRYVTIEPILDFNLFQLVRYIDTIKPIQVNIGADSRGLKLPEPKKEKVLKLIKELANFTTVHIKQNLTRLIR